MGSNPTHLTKEKCELAFFSFNNLHFSYQFLIGNEMTKKLLIFLITSILIIISCVTKTIVFKVSYNEYRYRDFDYLEYEECVTILLNEYELYEYKDYDRNYIRKYCHNLVGTNFYIMIDSIDIGRTGMVSPMTRTIFINKNTDDKYYAIAFTHELLHLKYFTGNETFTNYNTFVYLYESEDEHFKKIAIYFALDILYGFYEGNCYDCSYYIIEYFKEILENE